MRAKGSEDRGCDQNGGMVGDQLRRPGGGVVIGGPPTGIIARSAGQCPCLAIVSC
jgi:hypothetical protein